ncbi:Hypothetical predicted protein, partial [Scomber scombrus]
MGADLRGAGWGGEVEAEEEDRKGDSREGAGALPATKPVTGLETAPWWGGVELRVEDEDVLHRPLVDTIRGNIMCPQYHIRCHNGTVEKNGARTNNNDTPHRETQTASERQNRCCR